MLRQRMNAGVNEKWQKNVGRRISVPELMGLDAKGTVKGRELQRWKLGSTRTSANHAFRREQNSQDKCTSAIKLGEGVRSFRQVHL